MGRLIYSVIASLDLFVEDEHGDFSWAAPDREVHAFVNELERPIGTYLYGRGMYGTMRAWESMGGPEDDAVVREYAEIWRSADKVVYSYGLDEVSTARTQLVRGFVEHEVQRLKDQSDADLSIGGAALAATALAAGLVDEIRLLLVPCVVGAGKPALPAGRRLELDLLEERSFSSGAVHLRYAVVPART